MTLIRRPISIVVMGLVYILAPVTNLIQIALVTRAPLWGPVNLWNLLTWSDWAILVAFPVIGLGLLSVHRWGWVTFVVFSLGLIAYNTSAYWMHPVYSLGLVVLYNVVLAIVTFVFFRKHLRAPYFNPRLRWWVPARRYPVHLSTLLQADDGACQSEVLDLSVSGVFLSTCADIEVGQRVRFVMRAWDTTLDLQGVVMRRSVPSAPTPGFGVMFENLSPASRRQIKAIEARLVKEGVQERGAPAGAPLGSSPWHVWLRWYLKRLWWELVPN